LYYCEETYVDVDQFGSIHGVVYLNTSDNELIPIKNAKISTNPASTTGVITNENGEFYIDDVIAGDVIITVEKIKDSINYTIKHETIYVRKNMDQQQTLLLAKSENDPNEIKLFNPFPKLGVINQDTILTLSWDVTSNNKNLLYNVYYFTPDTIVKKTFGQGLNESSVNVTLKINTTYFWYVEAYDEVNTEYKINSPTWVFTTKKKE